MKASRPTVGAIALVSLAVALPYTTAVNSQQTTATETRSRFDNKTRRERLTYRGAIDPERRLYAPPRCRKPTEAPTGFDNLTNGFLPQGPDSKTSTRTTCTARSFNDNRFIFEEVEHISRRARAYLQRPELRGVPSERGHGRREPDRGAPHRPHEERGVLRVAGRFARSLAGDSSRHRGAGELRGRHPDVPDLDQHAGQRLRGVHSEQHAVGDPSRAARGHARYRRRWFRSWKPAASARIGRFGWKNQHASLKSFSADAYLNEMGITSPLFPDENTSSGRIVGYEFRLTTRCPTPRTTAWMSTSFADFMRSTKAPSRGPITADVKAGEAGPLQ